jgi:hypothetical protein
VGYRTIHLIRRGIGVESPILPPASRPDVSRAHTRTARAGQPHPPTLRVAAPSPLKWRGGAERQRRGGEVCPAAGCFSVRRQCRPQRLGNAGRPALKHGAGHSPLKGAEKRLRVSRLDPLQGVSLAGCFSVRRQCRPQRLGNAGRPALKHGAGHSPLKGAEKRLRVSRLDPLQGVSLAGCFSVRRPDVRWPDVRRLPRPVLTIPSLSGVFSLRFTVGVK